MSRSRRRNVFVVLKKALRSPFVVATITLGFIWALVFAGRLTGIAGFGAALMAAAIYALGRLHDESFIRTALREETERERKAAAESRRFRVEELDVDSRVRMKAIVRLADEIASDIVNSPLSPEETGLDDTIARTEALVDRGLQLAQRRRELLRYLSRTDPATIEARIGAIEAQIAAETDPAKRGELEASLSAKRRELEDYFAIRTAADRVLTELDSIECAFSSLRARLLRATSADVRDWIEANVELQAELSGLDSAVETLEETVNEILTLKNDF